MREMENVNLQKENSCLGAEGDGLLEYNTGIQDIIRNLVIRYWNTGIENA